MASVAAPRSMAMGSARRVAPCPEEAAAPEGPGPKDSPERLSFSGGQQRRLPRAASSPAQGAADPDVVLSGVARPADKEAPPPREAQDASDGSPGEPDENRPPAASILSALLDSVDKLDLGGGVVSEAMPEGLGGAGEGPGDEESAGKGPMAVCGASHLSAAALVDGGMQELEADSCSICLEAFSESDPATLTMCNHEFHFQCILEWAQRKEECPMCWQALQLSDPASQDLLEVCARERRDRAEAVAALEAQAQLAPIVAPRIVFIRAPAGTRSGPIAGARHRAASSWAARPASAWHGHAAPPPQAAPPAPAGRSVSAFFGGERSRRQGHAAGQAAGHSAGAARGAFGPVATGAGASGAAHAGAAPQGSPSAASSDAGPLRFWRSSKSVPREVPVSGSSGALSSSSSEAEGTPTLIPLGSGWDQGGLSAGREAMAPPLVSTAAAVSVPPEAAPVDATLSASSSPRSSLSPSLSLASSPAFHGAQGGGLLAQTSDALGPATVQRKQENAAPSTSGSSASSPALQGSASPRSAVNRSSSAAASWRSRLSLRTARSSERVNP